MPLKNIIDETPRFIIVELISYVNPSLPCPDIVCQINKRSNCSNVTKSWYFHKVFERTMAFVRALIKVFQFFVCWKKETNEGGKKKKKAEKINEMCGSRIAVFVETFNNDVRTTTRMRRMRSLTWFLIICTLCGEKKPGGLFGGSIGTLFYVALYIKKKVVWRRERERKEWWNNRFATKHKTCVELKQTMGKAI